MALWLWAGLIRQGNGYNYIFHLTGGDRNIKTESGIRNGGDGISRGGTKQKLALSCLGSSLEVLSLPPGLTTHCQINAHNFLELSFLP